MRIAFVVQRYGEDVSGGSEFLCRSLAERLRQHHDIEVLTTTARDYHTWAEQYPAGASCLNDVPVRRFAVDHRRDAHGFAQASELVFHRPHSLADELAWMELQGPQTEGLYRYLQDHHDQYDLFVFFTYLYCTTYFGFPRVADRAILVPTAHDEPPVYLRIFEETFRQARQLVFLSPEERFFVARRFCFPRLNGAIAGIGIEPPGTLPDDDTWSRIRQRLPAGPLLTYVGRVDESKGCRTLIDYFRHYHQERPNAGATLLLIGRAVMQVPDHPRIVAAGFVPEAAKLHAIRASRLTVAPSPYESLCIAALESWAARRPVLANGHCETLRGQCSRSGGGLWYRNYEEFRECLDGLLGDDHLSAALGEQGHRYVLQNYSWPRVERQYLEIFQAAYDEMNPAP